MQNSALSRPFHLAHSARFYLFSCLTLCLLAGDLSARQIAGWVEQASLIPSGIELKAKLDSGAKTSSINAKEIEFFTRDGEDFVRFKVKNKIGETVELTEPVIRQVSIKRHFGNAQSRPVVKLTVCLGGVSKEVEVNLVDRAGFNYPLLIGRSYLAGEFIIDPAKTHQLPAVCQETERP